MIRFCCNNCGVYMTWADVESKVDNISTARAMKLELYCTNCKPLEPTAPTVFRLNRLEDESGISGTGIVAHGVQFHNGKCVLCWLYVPTSSIVIYDSIDDLVAIHGHGGKTVVEWEIDS